MLKEKAGSGSRAHSRRSSASMSLQSAIPRRVALQQRTPLLHRLQSACDRLTLPVNRYGNDGNIAEPVNFNRPPEPPGGQTENRDFHLGIAENCPNNRDHRKVPDDYIEAVARVMVKANWHTDQVLTKRSERMKGLLRSRLRFAAESRHIWWGVSIDTRAYGLPRLRDLQASPASVRFLSIEPLLEGLGRFSLDGIHWVIVGGESGHGARPLKKDWVTSIRDQCDAKGIPFFFKQWGGVRKKKAGRVLDGRTYDGFPIRVSNPVSPAATTKVWAREILESYALPQSELLPIVA